MMTALHLYNTLVKHKRNTSLVGGGPEGIPFYNSVGTTLPQEFPMFLDCSFTSEGVASGPSGFPSNINLMVDIWKPCRSQYACINFFSWVFRLILKCTTDPSWADVKNYDFTS